MFEKSDYMGGGVLSENQLLTFDRYIKWNVPVSIKISNPSLPVFLLCESNLFCVKIKQKKLFSVFIKPLLQHNNLQKFPNATSITSSVGLDKTLAVPVITLVLTAEWNQ